MQLFSRIDKEIKGNVDLDAFVRALEGSTDVLFVEWCVDDWVPLPELAP